MRNAIQNRFFGGEQSHVKYAFGLNMPKKSVKNTIFHIFANSKYLDSFLDSIAFNTSAHKIWEIYSRFRVNEASNLLYIIQEVLWKYTRLLKDCILWTFRLDSIFIKAVYSSHYHMCTYHRPYLCRRFSSVLARIKRETIAGKYQDSFLSTQGCSFAVIIKCFRTIY